MRTGSSLWQRRAHSLSIAPDFRGVEQRGMNISHVNQEREILISLFFAVKSRFDTPVFMPRVCHGNEINGKMPLGFAEVYVSFAQSFEKVAIEREI